MGLLSREVSKVQNEFKVLRFNTRRRRKKKKINILLMNEATSDSCSSRTKVPTVAPGQASRKQPTRVRTMVHVRVLGVRIAKSLPWCCYCRVPCTATIPVASRLFTMLFLRGMYVCVCGGWVIMWLSMYNSIQFHSIQPVASPYYKNPPSREQQSRGAGRHLADDDVQPLTRPPPTAHSTKFVSWCWWPSNHQGN
jgi:hypothetical protein